MRVYFPTRNDNGVRDLSKSVTLGYFYDDRRGPAEPAAKAAMNPVNLGAVLPAAASSAPIPSGPVTDYVLWRRPTPPPPIFIGPREQSPANLPPPVSSQSTPTPQVSVPPAPAPMVIYVSSGGGTASPSPAASSPGVTQSPATSTVTAAPSSASMADQVAAWLGGTTAIGTWNVPNALLAGGVALGVALLMGGGGKKR